MRVLWPGKGRAPKIDFLIIGSAKCATTSFHHYLNQHPDIYLPVDCGVNHETGYFLKPGDQCIKGLTNEMIRKDVGRMFENYNQEKIVGERSTDYSKFPFRTVDFARIKAHNPSMKFLYFVADPIKCLKKIYRHNLRHHPEATEADFERELDKNGRYYEKVCSYYFQLKPYLAYFGPGNLRVIDIDQLDGRIDDVLSHIFHFLGVRLLTVKNTNLRYNVNEVQRSEGELRIPSSMRSRVEADFKRLRQIGRQTSIFI